MEKYLHIHPLLATQFFIKAFLLKIAPNFFFYLKETLTYLPKVTLNGSSFILNTKKKLYHLKVLKHLP